MFFLLTAAAFFGLGFALFPAVWRERETAPRSLEAALAVTAIGLTTWIATIWLLALTHALTRPALLARTLTVAAIVLLLLWRRGKASGERHTWDARVESSAVITGALFLPLFLWLIVTLWRGALIPPVSHDALSYHLPKAILFARAHGYEYLSSLGPILRKIPANYELMLADTILTQSGDALTEWVSTMFYVAFIIASGALAQRWIGKSLTAVAAMMLFAAAVPVLILHAGAHKNDVMTAFFMVSALVWVGRFIVRGELASICLGLTSLAAAIGTKPQAGVLAIALAIFMIAPLARLWRRDGWRPLAAVLVVAVLCLILLGGATYAFNYLNERPTAGAPGKGSAVRVIAYGDWRNLWEAPYVLLTAPFSPSSWRLWVPWSETAWFWRRYELFFSHLGIPFALCAILLPVAVILQKRNLGRERVHITIAAAATFLVMLPIRFDVHGMYAISLPRYALFIVPVVFGWTLVPLVTRASLRIGQAVLALGCVMFIWYAIEFTSRDQFAPWRYVLFANEHRGTRVIPFEQRRAASIADRLAGPNDTIAVYASYETWIYPVFGAALSRPVELIPDGTLNPVVSDAVRWIVVDLTWNIVWEHPQMRDLSQARYLTQGQLSPARRQLLDNLSRCPDFETAYLDLRKGQAVFRRRE